MDGFTIFTDTGCDLPRQQLDELAIERIELTLHTAAGVRVPLAGLDIPDFYQKMRDGAVYQTAAANLGDYLDAFEPFLRRGQDILYLCFSSGLSNTVNTARMAAVELEAQYPGRRVSVVDSRCASVGFGLFVLLAARKRDTGASLAETEAYLYEIVPRLCHWFTVDSLVFLRRGGRISAAKAIIGEALNLKPVLHMDDDGHLISRMKVRGRRQAVQALADKYAALAADPENGEYLIGHGDCLEDARQLEALIAGQFRHPAALIADIGPVIGAHSGPGTLALFFLGRQR